MKKRKKVDIGASVLTTCLFAALSFLVFALVLDDGTFTRVTAVYTSFVLPLLLAVEGLISANKALDKYSRRHRKDDPDE